MGCPVCGAQGLGDRAVGIHEDDDLCPICVSRGWEECGCRTDDETNEFVPCKEHAGAEE
jgi:hypothetical protein